MIVVASWIYVGAGYATEGERWLALPGRVGVDAGHPVPAQAQVQVPGQVRAPVAVAEQGHPRLVARIREPILEGWARPTAIGSIADRDPVAPDQG